MAEMRRQFLATLGANGLAQSVTVLGQLAVLPVLLMLWGEARTGSWLILMAMTTWLTLADLGFANVAANAMTMEHAAGRPTRAREISDSAWCVWAGAFGALVALAGLVVGLIPLEWLGVTAASADRSGLALLLLVLGIGVAMAHGVAGAAMRAEGQMHRAVSITALARGAEFAALLLAALAGAPFWGVALAMLAARASVTGIGWHRFYARNPAYRPGFARAGRDTICRLVPLSLGYFQFNLGHAFSIQGVTLVTGAVLGPGAVVVVTAVRTLARTGRMVAAVVIHASEPLFAQMAGRREVASASALSRGLMLAALAGAGAYGLAMGFMAAPVLGLWTGGVVTGAGALIAGFTLAVIFEILWFTVQSPFVSTNRHGPFGRAFLIASAIGLAALPLSLTALGAAGAGVLTAFIHAITLLWTLYRQRRPDMAVLPASERHAHAL